MKFEIPEQYKNGTGIYAIINMVNGKRIIGQTTDFEDRFGAYVRLLNKGAYGNKHLQSSYIKHGTDNFKMELLCLCDLSKLTEMEVHFCKTFNTLDRRFGYNKKDPVLHGKYTDDARQRMSLVQMGNKSALGHVLSEESRKKISVAKKGYKHSEEWKKNLSKILTGVPLSEEHKKRISEGLSGKTLSEEHKRKISESKMGQHPSEESRRKMSESRRGEKSSSYGKHPSLETRKKMSEAKIGNIPWNKGKKFSVEHQEHMSETWDCRRESKKILVDQGV